MTVNTPVIRAILSGLRAHNVEYVPLSGGLQVQILRSIRQLPRCRLHHFAAFIEDNRMLVVWGDEPKKLLAWAQELEKRAMEMIWVGEAAAPSNRAYKDEDQADEEAGVEEVEQTDRTSVDADPDEGRRPIRLSSAVLVSCTLTLCLSCIGLGLRNIALEISVDENYSRLALLVMVPIYFFFGLVSVERKNAALVIRLADTL
jgi:hypothetical protein